MVDGGADELSVLEGEDSSSEALIAGSFIVFAVLTALLVWGRSGGNGW